MAAEPATAAPGLPGQCEAEAESAVLPEAEQAASLAVLLRLFQETATFDLAGLVAALHAANQATVDACLGQLWPSHSSTLLARATEACADTSGLAWQGRAKLVRSVFRVGEGAWNTDAYAACILAAFGPLEGQALYSAKAYVDDGEDKLTLHLLVFKTLPPAPRAALLRHFAAGAAAASGPPARPNIVAVDIDDTLHPYLFDQSSAAGEPYPGVLDCLAALVAGPQGGTPGRLAVITARPGLARSYTRAAMRKLGLGHATVYTGTLTALVSTDSMAARKLHNFDRLRQLWPEGRLVWVGDMGQGDCLAGQQLLAQPCPADCPPPLVLMHDIVLRGAKQVPSTCLAKRRQLARTGVFVFDSYIDAAVVAVQAGAADPRCLLPLALAALRRVGLRPPRLAAHADTLAAWAEQQVPVQGEQLPSFRLPEAAVAGEVLGMPRAPTKAPAPTAPPAAAATDAAAVSPSHAGALQGPPPPRMPPPPLTLPVGLGLYAVTGSAGHATCRGMAVPRTCPLGLPGLAVQWQSGDDVAADGGLRMPGCAPRTDTADPAQYPGLSTSQPSPGGLPATPHHVQVLGGAAATTAIHNASCGCSPATALSDDSPWPSWAHAQAAPAVQAAAAASRYQNLRENMRRVEAQAAAERALALLALAAAVPDPPCRAGEGGGGP